MTSAAQLHRYALEDSTFMKALTYLGISKEKRQWGFNYIMTKKSMKRASADVGLMMTAHNLRRIINILGIERFREFLEARVALFLSKLANFGCILANSQVLLRTIQYWMVSFVHPVNRLTLTHIETNQGSF